MKKVLITGGATGIGKACAELFKASGYEVYITYNKTLPETEGMKVIECNLENLDDIKTAFDLIDDVAGIIGMSAVPLNQPTVTQKRLPVLLTHGQADDVVPFAGMEFNQAVLQQMNQNVSTCVQPFMGHNIDETCLQAVRFFLTSCLSEYPHDPDNS